MNKIVKLNNFEFSNDGHWNSLAHEIILSKIVDILNFKKAN